MRPRSIGEILDLSFQIYRARWASMIGATGVLMLPLLLLEAVAPLNALGFLERIGGLFFLAAAAAVVAIASGAYRGEDVDAVDAIRAVRERFLSVWGAAIMQGLLIGLGLLLLVVPGILALAYTFAMQQAVMVEGHGTNDAWERSRELASDNLKPILATTVVAFLIVFAAMMGVGTILGMVFTSPRIILLAINLANIVLAPLAAVVSTVMYYDLRIRKEAFDVTFAAERLDAAAPVAMA